MRRRRCMRTACRWWTACSRGTMRPSSVMGNVSAAAAVALVVRLLCVGLRCAAAVPSFLTWANVFLCLCACWFLVFAAGAGKSYTMQGDVEGSATLGEHAGILPRALQQLLQRVAAQETDPNCLTRTQLRAQYTEI